MAKDLTDRMRIEKAKLEDFRQTNDALYLARGHEDGSVRLWKITAVLTDNDKVTGKRTTTVKIESDGNTESCTQDGLDECVFRLFDVSQEQRQPRRLASQAVESTS